MFVRSGTTWAQQAFIKASNPGGGDFFGESVALSGDTAVVGALGENSSANGVNGDQSDNAADASGAVYVMTGLVSAGIGEIVCAGTPNSTGLAGTLSASGSLAVTDNSLTLEIACCPADRAGVVVTSSSNGGPIQTVSAGSGFLCISTPQLGFFPVAVTDQNGAATQVVDLTAIPTSAGPAAALPGDTFFFQYWHRDSVGGTPTSNLTSAASVLLQ